MPKKDQQVWHEGIFIFIKRDAWHSLCQTTYREDIFQEISSVTWSLNKGYPTNGKFGDLHRYVMKKWYGEDIVKRFSEDGYVIDHMDNDHTNSCISNLYFLKQDYNTAKGQQFDKDSARIMKDLAISIARDFTTGYFQITIGCNAPIKCKDGHGHEHLVNVIRLLYEGNSYPIVINDADNIIQEYDSTKGFSIKSLHCVDAMVEFAPEIEFSEDEKKSGLAIRNGQVYSVLGTGACSLVKVHHIEGWIPRTRDAN